MQRVVLRSADWVPQAFPITESPGNGVPRPLVAQSGCASQEFVAGAVRRGGRPYGRKLLLRRDNEIELGIFVDGGLQGFGGDGGSVAL
jgi:hypothetical protein